jgi:hypothetical protein
VLYLLHVRTLGTLISLGLRASRARPKTRVIGPDDDPDFLWRLSHGDNQP